MTDCLTITKNGVEQADQNQTFLFRITGTSGGAASNVSLTVAVTGNGSVTVQDIPVGTYTVSEITDWSWRYGPAQNDQSITVTKGGANTVTFTNQKKNTAWLGGEASADNRFQAVSEP